MAGGCYNTKQTKSGIYAHIAIKSFRNQKVEKMLIAISNGHEIRQVDIASIINTISDILLNCVITSHIFSE